MLCNACYVCMVVLHSPNGCLSTSPESGGITRRGWVTWTGWLPLFQERLLLLYTAVAVE
jgi:hypothetical protein